MPIVRMPIVRMPIVRTPIVRMPIVRMPIVHPPNVPMASIVLAFLPCFASSPSDDLQASESPKADGTLGLTTLLENSI